MKNLLIVEDEAILLKALKDNLSLEGYEISTATNGDEAIEKIKVKVPDLMLLDLLMPKRDGFYVLEEIKKDPKCNCIKTIVLSNLGGDEEIKKAFRMGATDYFVKSQHEIEEIIGKVKEQFK